MRNDILTELGNKPDRLQANLDVIKVVLGFLSSGGGNPEVKLVDYMDNVLKIQRRSFSIKVF